MKSNESIIHKPLMSKLPFVHAARAAMWMRLTRVKPMSAVSVGLLTAMGVISHAEAINVSGVANTYYGVSSVAGSTANLGGGTAGAGHALAAGDKVLLIEMTGANMGVHEKLTVSSTGAGTVTFSTAITRVYGGGVKQLVHIPSDATVTVTADVTAPAWNGQLGGVVALSGTTLTLNAHVDASEKGFSGAFPPGGGSDGSGPPAFYNGFWTISAGGGGGIIGGGGGGGGSPQTNFNDRTTAAASQATEAVAGMGVAGSGTTFAGGNGGSPGLVGNGGDGDIGQVTSTDYPGTPGAGGGSYGAGGGTVASVYSSAYTAGGGGGGSWNGGGQGGRGGTAMGDPTPHPDGLAGAPAQAGAIPTANHFLHDGNARLMMGGAGGAGPTPADEPEGKGGGVIFLDFSTIVGNNNGIMSNGGNGIKPVATPRSGSGGGAGGQIYVKATTKSNFIVAANGGRGGAPTANNIHVGAAGGSGGGGGIWFAGGSPVTNSGPNAADNSDSSSMPAVGAGIKWYVMGGGAVPNPFATVTIAGTVYAFDDWIDIYNQAGVYSLTNGVMMGPAIAVTLGVPEADVRAQFPELFTWSNPKNAGFSAMPGLGGVGLVSVTSVTMPCAITAVDVTPGACNDNGTPANSADDYYTASVSVTFSDKPSSGNLVLSGAALHSSNSVTTVAVASTTSAITHVYAGVRIKADNVANALTATFSADSACTLTVNPAAVPNCSVPLCAITNLIVTPGACNDNSTPNDMSDDYYTASVTATFANKPASGNLVLSGVALHSSNSVTTVAVGSTTSATSHTFAGVKLKSNNVANALTATFSADLPCTLTVNAPTVPNCSVPLCDMVSLDVTPGACNDNGTPIVSADDFYVGNVTVTFSNKPSSGNLVLSGAALHASNSVSTVAAVATNSTTSHTFVGVRIKANGSVNPVTATFSADVACTITADAGSVPSCSVPPAQCCPQVILAAP